MCVDRSLDRVLSQGSSVFMSRKAQVAWGC
jgi:hypothetical protein